MILYDPAKAKISSHTECLLDICDLTLQNDILKTLFFSPLKMNKLKRSDFEFLCNSILSKTTDIYFSQDSIAEDVVQTTFVSMETENFQLH